MCHYWDSKVVSILFSKLSNGPNTDTSLCYCSYSFFNSLTLEVKLCQSCSTGCVSLSWFWNQCAPSLEWNEKTVVWFGQLYCWGNAASVLGAWMPKTSSLRALKLYVASINSCLFSYFIIISLVYCLQREEKKRKSIPESLSLSFVQLTSRYYRTWEYSSVKKGIIALQCVTIGICQ